MTTYAAGTRGDGLRVKVSGVELVPLSIVGTIRGVTPLAAGARCGPGTGLLVFTPSPPALAFRAPGSSTTGVPCRITRDGDFVLEDGADKTKFLRVRIATAWLPSSPAQASVFLLDRYNEAGPNDVTAVQATAGNVQSFALTLENETPSPVYDVRAWLDPLASGLAISTDNATWKTPTSETDPNVLVWASVAVGASVTLYVRRTITAGAASAAAVLNLIQLGWTGL